ncbi:hypothetical protein [Xenorhabdus vietnamensis]|nr:hypothetical protein [Xenorhabdus vietnamensis]
MHENNFQGLNAPFIISVVLLVFVVADSTPTLPASGHGRLGG